MKNFAFIFEGATEQVFYLHLLDFLAVKYNVTFLKNEDNTGSYYIIGKDSIVRYWTVNTITQLPTAGKWFNNICNNNRSQDWVVFLCYDTDNYKYDITKFQEGDWNNLRKDFSEASVIDLAAAADIEDVMLQDFKSVKTFFGLNDKFTLDDFRGKKGKVKLKEIGRLSGNYYHEGERAKDLINALDMQKIIDSNIVPLSRMETEIFIRNIT